MCYDKFKNWIIIKCCHQYASGSLIVLASKTNCKIFQLVIFIFINGLINRK